MLVYKDNVLISKLGVLELMGEETINLRLTSQYTYICSEEVIAH